MKFKFLLLLLVACLSTGSKAADTPNGYKIKVTITGLKDSVCYLANYYGDKQYLQDTAKVNSKGEFTFEDPKKTLEKGMYIVVGSGKVRFFDFIINKEQVFSMKTNYTSMDSSMAFTGSEENTLFYKYIGFLRDQRNLMEPLQKAYKAAAEKSPERKAIEAKVEVLDSAVYKYKQELFKKNPTSFVTSFLNMMEDPKIPEPPIVNGKKDSSFAYYYYKNHYFDNFNLQDDGLVRTPLFHQKLERFFTEVLPQIPDTINAEADKLIAKAKGSKENFKYIVYYITNATETSKVMGMDASFVHMVDKYYATKQAYWIDADQLLKITERAKLLKPITLGKVAPEMSLTDTFGKVQTLSKVQAKYTLICFWDPDCSHCKKEVPELFSTYKDLVKKGIDMKVYAVGTTAEDDKWRKFIKDHKLNWINVIDLPGARARYDIYSTPVLYLLDKDKKIIAKRVGHDNLEEIISRTEKGQKVIVTQKEEEKEGH